MDEFVYPPKRQSSRQLRERKQKKLYSEDWALGDEEIEGRHIFSIQEKLEDDKFTRHGFVKEMIGSEFNVAYIQRNGFTTPLLFVDRAGLGLNVPSSNFSVNEIRLCVGSRRILDVMDVNTQKNSEMTMKEWQKYYEDPDKDKLLNVISLEFSHTKLENYVQTPTIVRQVDWVDCVWPRHLKESQTEATNLLEDMKYPKVQKYCLMSVKGCYTDFHVDFGGTSVWYHIVRGGKVFWLIPPTEHNLDLYERWVLSGKQSDIFFGDTVEQCERVHLTQGNTFFIPTGWIHAVYTPEDSLVFGGNFLHSFGIDKQLKIAQVEDATKVPQKFRYPFFTEMLWYVLERYVHCLLGRSHLKINNDEPPLQVFPHMHLTYSELLGLKEIIMYLHLLPPNKKNVPDLLIDPIPLIHDVRILIGLHRLDSRESAITGRCILTVPEDQENNVKLQTRVKSSNKAHKSHKNNNGANEKNDKNGPRRRRTRCKKCEACQRSDCGECSFCLDMVKFGGPGRAKQTCNMRQCLQPMLPVTAACTHCGLDGWGQTPVVPLVKGPQRHEAASSLMECSVCYEIVHPACAQRLCPQFTGYVNEDMPNSWECPVCCKLGKNADYKPRHFRARQKSSDLRRMSVSSDASSAFEVKVQQDPCASDSGSENEKDLTVVVKKRRTSEGELETKVHVNEAPRKQALRIQLAHQLTSSSTKSLKKPMLVVRPAPAPLLLTSPTPSTSISLDKRWILLVFRYLSPSELFKCSLVCKTWAHCSIDSSLWRVMDFKRKQISPDYLRAIVRRQPETLFLDWASINKQQLPWVVQRARSLRELSLISIDVKSVVGLRSCYCSQLNTLDVSFISGFTDVVIREILGPNNDSRRGLSDERVRLRNLKTLKAAGTDITDIAMRYVTQYLPNLAHLSLSCCSRITDAGITQLCTKPANTLTNLISLDLSQTKLVTEVSLEQLSRCEKLTRLDMRHCIQVSTQALIKFAAKSEHNLQVRDIKLVDRRLKDLS